MSKPNTNGSFLSSVNVLDILFTSWLSTNVSKSLPLYISIAFLFNVWAYSNIFKELNEDQNALYDG